MEPNVWIVIHSGLIKPHIMDFPAIHNKLTRFGFSQIGINKFNYKKKVGRDLYMAYVSVRNGKIDQFSVGVYFRSKLISKAELMTLDELNSFLNTQTFN